MKKIDEKFFQNDKEKTSLTIEDCLTKDEQILWKGKPKKSAFILNEFFKMFPIALIWLLIDGGIIAVLIINKAFNQMPVFAIIFIVIFFAIHLIPVWFWISNIVTANKRHKNIEYVFTNERILIKSGLVGIDLKTIYYSEIQFVNLKVGIIDKMLKVGDIYITASFHSAILYDIEDPYNISTKLQKIVNDIKTDIEYPNELRPAENYGYKTQLKNINLKNNNDEEKWNNFIKK